jgi:plasmid stabilization system protein ParE
LINVRLLEGAESDLAGAAGFLEHRLRGLGTRFTDSVQRSLTRIAENANLGVPIGVTYRKLRVRQFPYNVIYRIELDEVLVVAIAHHRRKPDYWRRRV